MAQGNARLTAVEVRQVKPDPTGKSKILPDGGGLRLLVHPNGSKYWQFRTSRAGKETSFQLGTFPQLDLASARELAEDLRRKARAGVDLTVERKLDKLNREVAAAITFRSVA